jgi:hypothetical protein
MALRLNGSSSGYVELDAPATAGSNTLTLPDGNGTSGQYLQTDGSGGLSWQTIATPTNITVGTAADLTSQGSIVYSSIPSGTKRITVLVSGLSMTANTYRPTVRIGSGGSTVSTGYVGRTAYNTQGASPTTGFELYFWGLSTNTLSAKMSIENIDGNTWVESHVGGSDGWGTIQYGSSVVTLGGTLDTLELTTTSTGTFAQGTVNVYYEAA